MKRNAKIAGAAAAAVVVLAVGIGVTAHAQIGNFIHKSFGSPVSYYQYVEEKNRDEDSEGIAACYDAVMDSMTVPKNSEVSYKLELGQSLKTMLSMTGMDFSALNNAEMKVNSRVEDDVISAKIKGRLNDADAVTLNVFMDYAGKKGYFQIPEMSETYLDFSKAFEDEEVGEGLLGFQNFSELREKYFPETEQIQTIIETYTDLFLKEMDTVEKSDGDLEAAGVKAQYTVLKVTCKGKKLYDIASQMMSTLKEDQTIKEILSKEDDEVYSDFTASVEDAMEDLAQDKDTVTDEDAELVMNVYVDSDGEIAGRVIDITGQGDHLKITSVCPQNGSEFGMTLSMESNDVNYFTLSGKGTHEDGMISGDFTVGMDDSLAPSNEVISNTDELLDVTVTNLDEKTLKKEGTLNGSFHISSQAIASFTSYALQLDCKTEDDVTTQALSVECAGDKLVTLTATDKEGEAFEDAKPGEGSEVCDVTDEEAFDAYMSGLDADQLLADIQEKCGVDLSTYADMIRYYLMGDSYSSYELDETDESLAADEL